jgi:hypothetical protein
MSSVVDLLISYKFAQILATPWNQMEAYRLGIIDAGGKILKPRASLKTAEEKKAYPSVFYTLAWNIKRLLEFNSPCLLGKGINLANRSEFAVRTILLKEYCERQGADPNLIERLVSEELDRKGLLLWTMNEETQPVAIEAGSYRIRGRRVSLDSQLLPTDEFFGFPIYRLGNLTFTINDVQEDAPANAVGHGNIAGTSPGQEPPGRRGLLFKRKIRRQASSG